MRWQGKFKAGLRDGVGQQLNFAGEEYNFVTKRIAHQRRRRRRRGELSELNISLLKLNQETFENRVRKWWYCEEVEKISPTLMVFRPIKVVYSYDVIRGGHRLFRFVRR